MPNKSLLESWLRIYEVHFMAMRVIRVASAGRSSLSFSSSEKTGGESLLLRTPTFHPHRADRCENPTFHPTGQSVSTRRNRPHRTMNEENHGCIRRQRTSPTVCSHLIIPRSWVRSCQLSQNHCELVTRAYERLTACHLSSKSLQLINDVD